MGDLLGIFHASRISCGFPSVGWQHLPHCTKEQYGLERFKLPVKAHEPGNTVFLSPSHLAFACLGVWLPWQLQAIAVPDC